MTAYRFLEPLDVLILRGNKLFGDAGSYGESLVPPWPSVAAGAIRSHMMVSEGVDFDAFRSKTFAHPVFGNLETPGSFTVTEFWVAKRHADGAISTVHPLPADLVVTDEAGQLKLRRLRPIAAPRGVASSAPLPKLPVLATDKQGKPRSHLWLTQQGWAKYLRGETPEASDLELISRLWQLGPRVGVGLDTEKRSAAEGQLFTVQAVAMAKRGQRIGEDTQSVIADYDAGFLVGIDGAEPPAFGTLRFGGDGRAAAIHAGEYVPPSTDLEAIAATGRCRIVLTTPGLFPGGWRPSGVGADNRFELGGVSGRLVCAAVPRAEVISGWDLAKREPKPAQRVAPVGSVYWLEDLQATPEALRKLVERGLWAAEAYDGHRRAEGFNRFAFAVY